VIDTVSADFYQAVSLYVEPEIRELIEQVQSAGKVTEVLRSLLKGALADDPRLASRLSLWGRRLLGEALIQAQRVSFEQGFPAGLIAGDEAVAGTMLADTVRRLAENHSRRMAELGLTG
jgi:hypothetical protein